MNAAGNLHVEGLAGIEYAELEESLPAGTLLTSPQEARTDLDYGEPILISALILATAAAVNAFSAWLANRKKEDPSTEITIVPNPDGTVTVRVGVGAAKRTGQAETAAEICSGIEDALKAAAAG